MNNTEQIGKITKGLFLKVYIGDGKTDEGKEFEFAVTANYYEPLVMYGKRTFHLSWNDICNLAEQAGLFKDEAEVQG